MGKFKKGVRVRLTEEHDDGGPKVGALGTIFGKDEDGDHDVVWDGLEEGHDGLANDGSNNHWYVPKSKLELVEEPTKAPFTVGDRAKVLGGEQVTIDSEVDALDHVWVVGAEGARRRLPVSWLSTAWVPKVGDRVRMVKDGFSTTGAVGKLATLEAWSDGKFIDGDQYLLNIDGPVDYETRAVTENYTRATIDCFVPAAAEAQPAVGGLWAPVIGKYGKTRSGKKVMVKNTIGEDFPFRAGGNHYNADGSHYYGEDHKDLVAEWVDEPVAAVEEVAVAEATATPTFKVGDRVRYVGRSASYSDPWMIGLEGVVTAFAGTLVDVKWDSVYVDGKCTGGAKYPDNIELVTDTTPAANDNLVVTITAKNESVADALRTIAVALNAA